MKVTRCIIALLKKLSNLWSDKNPRQDKTRQAFVEKIRKMGKR